MTSEALCRAIRYYYKDNIMAPHPGRFTFSFGPACTFHTTGCSTTHGQEKY
ncbi:unnamed protein product, partial [Rotaria sp. Silwood2]